MLLNRFLLNWGPHWALLSLTLSVKTKTTTTLSPNSRHKHLKPLTCLTFFGQMPFILKHLYLDHPTKNEEESAMNSQGKKIAIYCTCHGWICIYQEPSKYRFIPQPRWHTSLAQARMKLAQILATFCQEHILLWNDTRSLWAGACNSTILGVFIDRFIFRSNLLWMRLPWECHNQSQDTNWRHCVTGPELTFFHKRKGVLKTDQSVRMPWHRLSMGVASSCSSAPDDT